jgi:hypothetical protein
MSKIWGGQRRERRDWRRLEAIEVNSFGEEDHGYEAHLGCARLVGGRKRRLNGGHGDNDDGVFIPLSFGLQVKKEKGERGVREEDGWLQWSREKVGRWGGSRIGCGDGAHGVPPL